MSCETGGILEKCVNIERKATYNTCLMHNSGFLHAHFRESNKLHESITVRRKRDVPLMQVYSPLSSPYLLNPGL